VTRNDDDDDDNSNNNNSLCKITESYWIENVGDVKELEL
jgi:hypothetical protein